MTTNNELLRIMERISNTTATDEEIIQFNIWCDSFRGTEQQVPGLEEIQSKVLARIHQTINRKKARIIPMYARRFAAAAAVILVVSAGLFYYRSLKFDQSLSDIAKQDIAPGSNKAILTLGSGKRIVLTGAANGELAKEEGVVITKAADGQLIYTVSGKDSNSSDFNTIETPRGGQHQLRLPDGTEIWLNAATTLKYPANFTALKERRVQLSGEAYFQVAKDGSHPFIVETDRSSVEVLGTHFDVNAYKDDAVVKTTLLEGSVKVLRGAVVKVIKPNQQAVSDGGGIVVKEVVADDAIAWKNGYFMFSSDRLDNIMSRIARWYDVDVVYGDESLKREIFLGTISRYEKISKVLRMLERTGTVVFEVKGNTVRINRKE